MVYLSMESGALYSSGGWEDQPEWFFRAYEIVRAETHQWQKKKNKGPAAKL
jgi:hypothetical protein